ncbi:NUDIX domain-containing protein [Halobacterium bonnevillei]|uniref:NUDIX domain-containing protein n=1 Tax=Halobacterium bonnevillei TaxID=2692200 RepID=A0A6B0SL23_9EURY|nr:NUDIX domain-containing protein [Halobacterium bonnevillei]MXR21937.1 NUDIX domain-containing protein [Halobacterium bonnevillei]
MPVRPTYDGVSKTCLLDPEECRERTDVLFREETEVVDDRGAFNGHETWAGTVAVGVLNDDGEVLLVNAPQGWTLPASPVKAGDDWAAVARRWVAQKTGLAVDVERPERVRRTSYRLAGSSTRQTTGYDVVFRAAPLDDETPMDYLNAKRASADGDEWADDWFGSVPDGVADDAFREDVAWFVGR